MVNNNRAHKLLSPLGLLVLAACSGGSSGTSISPSGFTRDGNVIKGPLKDALAFLDYDGDGVKDADEPSVATDADGKYSLSGSAGNENVSVVVLTDDSTVDASTGAILSGVVLTAPAAAKVVSLASTLVVKAQEADANLTVAEATAKVQASLGLTGVSDLLDFNPYAAGVDATEAAKVEVASQQISSVLTTLASAAESAGLSGEDAIAASLAAVTTVVAGKGTGETVDLTDTSGTGDLAVIADAVKATVATEAAKAGSTVNSTAFEAMVDSTVTAVANVNTKVATVTDLSAAGVADIFSVSQVLVTQVSEAVTAEKALAGSGASKVELTDSTKVDAAATNKAPTDIDLVVGGSAVAEGEAITVSEGTGSLAIANIAVTDSDNGAAGFTYALAGDDASSFSIADGVLSFAAQPDYETKSSYSVAIQATDSGGKTFAETFAINISDIDEGSYNQKFQVVTDGTSDAVFKDYVSGTNGVFESPANVDLSVASGAADFGTLSLDVTNINAGLAGGSSFQDPSLDIVLAKLPVVSGTKTETIKITVVDGADASRDAATERSFEISFDVVLSGSGSTFAIAPQPSASISYLGKGDASPTTATLNGITNNTLSYASSTSTLSVKMLSLINQATSIVPSTVLGSGGDFHVTISGLPLLDEDGGDISSITGKLSISDRDHTPLLTDPGTKTLTEAATVAGSTSGTAAVSGTLVAQDAEGDAISYSVSGGTLNGAGTDYSLAGTYGTLTVNKATGDYTYTLDNTKSAVDGLSASDTVKEEFTVQAGDGKTTGSDTLTIAITGANDAPQSIASSGTTITENASGAVVGVLSAQDPEGDGVVFTLESVDNYNLFTIANVGGKNTLKLKDGQSANFESTPTLLVTVKASDGTNYTNKSFTISVTNVNETPTLSQPIQGQVTEDSGAAAIGTLIASDPDKGTTLEYKIDSASAALSGTDYVLAGLYGTLTLNKNTGNYSYDVNNSNGTVNALSTGENLTETFGLVVSDGVNTSAQRSLTFKINGNNDAPGTVALSSSTVAENAAGATIGTLNATDPEGNSITYSVDSSNDGDKFEIINGTTLKLKDTVSADYEAATSYSVTVNASDSNSQSQTTLTVNVVDKNDPPFIAFDLLDQTVTEDQNFNFKISKSNFSDQDVGDVLTLSASLADGNDLPSWLQFDADSGEFSGSPTNESVGVSTLKISADDSKGGTISNDFKITVINTNDNPNFLSAASATSEEDNPFSFQVTASDPDVGDNLTLSTADLPSWVSFSNSTLTATPTNKNVGSHKFTLSAVDTAGAKAEQIFTLNVENTNDAPVVLKIIPDQTLTEDAAFNFTLASGTFSDVDIGDELSFSSALSNGSNLPSWLNFNSSNATFTGTPLNEHVGNISVRVIATDKFGSSVYTDSSFIIENTNDVPTIISTPDLAVTEDSYYSYIAYANDVDTGDTTTVTILDKPNWLSFSSNNNLLSGTPTNDDVGTHSVIIKATDNYGGETKQSFAIEVTNSNDAPVVNKTLQDDIIIEDQAFSIIIPSDTFIDIDSGDELILSATLASGTILPASWISFDSETGTLSGTALNEHVGAHSIRIYATDKSNLSIFDDIELTVLNSNDAPTFSSSPSLNATLGSQYNYSIEVADVDLKDTRTISVIEKPTWLSLINTTLSGTPQYSDLGANSVKLKVVDAAGAEDTQIFSINVQQVVETATWGGNSYNYTFPSNTYVNDSTSLSVSGLPSWLSFNSQSKTVTGTTPKVDVRMDTDGNFKAYNANTSQFDSSLPKQLESSQISLSSENSEGTSQSFSLLIRPDFAIPIKDTSKMVVQDFPVSGLSTEQALNLSTSYVADLGTVLNLGSFDLDYQNLIHGKDNNPSTTYTSPQIVIDLPGEIAADKDIDLGLITIKLIQVKNKTSENTRTRESDEEFAYLMFTSEIRDSESTPASFTSSQQLQGQISIKWGSGLAWTNVPEKIDGVNDTIEYTTATSTEPAKLKLNLLALSDDLGFGSTLLPIERGEYYASVDGIPFEFEDGTFIDILEATVNIV